jgi:guanylate kinase
MSSKPAVERGLLFVVSAPSGTGKTTVVDRLMERAERLARSRSYTSRPARAGEIDGVDYNFVSRTAFERLIQDEALLEWADIFGNLYGTARQDTEVALAAGLDLVLTIDVQGARQVRQRDQQAVGIFVLPPSLEILAARLRGRNKDPETAIVTRLATARNEVGAVEEYDYVVVNDDLERCVREIQAIIVAERAKLARRRDVIQPIVASFRSPIGS